MSGELMQAAALIQGDAVQADSKKIKLSAETPAALFLELLTNSFAAQAENIQGASAGELFSSGDQRVATAPKQQSATVESETAKSQPVRTEAVQTRQSNYEPRQEVASTRAESTPAERQETNAYRETAQTSRQAGEQTQQAQQAQQAQTSNSGVESPREQTAVASKAVVAQVRTAVAQETAKQEAPALETLRANIKQNTATSTQGNAATQETIVKEAPAARSLESSLLGAEAQRNVKAGTQQSAVQELTQFLGKAAVRSTEAVQPSGQTQSGNQAGGEQQGGNAQPQQSTANASANEIFAQVLGNGAETSANAVKQAAAVRVATSAQVQQAAATQNSAPATTAASRVPTQQQGVAEGQKTAQTARSQQPVPAERVIRQVVQAARISVTQGREEIKLVLKPDSLGTLRIKITVQGQQVTAHITAENEGVRDALETNVRQLQQALENQNLRVNQIVVSLQGDGQAQQQADQSGRQGHGGVQQENRLAEEETELVASDAEQGGETKSVSQVDLRV